jgi:hypothetical protein
VGSEVSEAWLSAVSTDTLRGERGCPAASCNALPGCSSLDSFLLGRGRLTYVHWPRVRSDKDARDRSWGSKTRLNGDVAPVLDNSKI